MAEAAPNSPGPRPNQIGKCAPVRPPPAPVAHLSIWEGLVVGLVGAAPALASVWILVGVW